MTTLATTTAPPAVPLAYSSRRWCFTLNHWSIGELDALRERCSGETYAVIGQEVGESGTPHLQGFIILKAPHRLSYMKTNFSNRAHWEPAVASSEQAADYCKKPVEKGGQGFEEFGTLPQEQGKRTDIARGIDLVKSGADGIQRLVREDPELYVKFAGGFERLASRWSKEVLVSSEPRSKPLVTWLYGPSGAGKTRWVVERETRRDLWISGSSLRWVDGYDGEPAALFDDFRADFATLHWLFRLLDRYPVRCEVKYGHVIWNPDRIYITAPYHPRDVYETQENLTQLIRRIDTVYYVVAAEDGDPVLRNVTRCKDGEHPGPKHPRVASVDFTPPPLVRQTGETVTWAPKRLMLSTPSAIEHETHSGPGSSSAELERRQFDAIKMLSSGTDIPAHQPEEEDDGGQ